jgi:cytochrome b
MPWPGTSAGLLVLALLAFRLLWGVVGGRWSRFASFIYAPATVLRYLRGQARPANTWTWATTRWAAVGVRAAGLAGGAGRHRLVADDEIANRAR